MIGVSGLALSMIGFGLSKTFWALVISRAIAGALNGNQGVVKSLLGELTDDSNMAQAFSFLPICWAGGSTIGCVCFPFFFVPLTRNVGVVAYQVVCRWCPFQPWCTVSTTLSVSILEGLPLLSTMFRDCYVFGLCLPSRCLSAQRGRGLSP